MFDGDQIIYEFVSVGECASVKDENIYQNQEVVLLMRILKKEFETLIE